MRNKLLILLAVMVLTVIWRISGEKTPNSIPLNVRGIILPHHDLARDLIIKAVDKIKTRQNPPVIVVLSPNHFRPQSETFTSSKESEAIKSGYQELLIDDQLVNNEHGIYIPVNILREAFPKSQFVPVLVSTNFTRENLKKMANALIHYFPPETLYVASADFSHNQMILPAMQFNQQTINTIKSFNYDQLLSYTDDNLDSPAAVGILMMIMQQSGTTKWDTWENTHGSIITGNPLLQGTSYVIGVFQ